MDGKVNGAVETCFGSFHRYAQYMNFSHPLIKARFNPKACAWAYGMNFFDLDAWRREKCTEEYHYWQNLVRPLSSFILLLYYLQQLFCILQQHVVVL
jgi:alpha-1,4-galacturonosyltransferase